MTENMGYPLIAKPDGPDYFIIMGIDPGTTSLGVGVLKVDINTLQVVGSNYKALNANKPSGGRLFNDWMVEYYGERSTRIRELAWMLGAELNHYRPLFVCCETAFFNATNASAFGPLMEVIKTVENSVYAWNCFRPLYRIETTVAKQAIAPVTSELKTTFKALCKSKTLDSSKARVLWCSQHHPEFSNITANIPYNEHGLDALVIAYAQLLRIRQRNFTITF